MMRKFLIPILFISLFNCLNAQSEFPNSRFLEDDQTSPQANLEAINWLAGSWHGEAFGGITEEIWSNPLGGSMMGSFKLVVDNQVSFYELMTITEENSSLIMKIKHFDKDLTGWEEKEESVVFKLVEVQPDHVFFNGLSIQRINDNEIKIFVVIEHEGNKNEVEFPYHKIANP